MYFPIHIAREFGAHTEKRERERDVFSLPILSKVRNAINFTKLTQHKAIYIYIYH